MERGGRRCELLELRRVDLLAVLREFPSHSKALFDSLRASSPASHPLPAALHALSNANGARTRAAQRLSQQSGVRESLVTEPPSLSNLLLVARPRGPASILAQQSQAKMIQH